MVRASLGAGERSSAGSVLPDVHKMSFSQHPERIKRWASKGNVESQYTLGEELGSGAFGVVRLATHNETKTQWAVKCMSLEKLGGSSSEDEKALWNEVGLLLGLDHPNICRMTEFFVVGGDLFLVMDLLEGGELLDALCDKGNYTESDAREVMRQLLSALAYLHSKGVVHRDIKLGNLMLPSEEDQTTIKLIDFGLSLRTTEEHLSMLCGTPVYVAPELATAVLTKRKRRKQGLAPLTYTKAVDVWACGVIMYLLLVGEVPFKADDEIGMFKTVVNNRLHLGGEDWQHVSAGAKAALKRMLERDPNKRATAADMLSDPWFATADADVDRTDGRLDNAAAKLRALKARRRMKAVANTIRAVYRMTTTNSDSREQVNEGTGEGEAGGGKGSGHTRSDADEVVDAIHKEASRDGVMSGGEQAHGPAAHAASAAEPESETAEATRVSRLEM